MKIIKTNFKKFKGKPSLISNNQMYDWDGSLIFKSKTATSDKKNFIETIKTMATLGSCEIEIKDPYYERIREKIKKREKEDLEKMKRYLKGKQHFNKEES